MLFFKGYSSLFKCCLWITWLRPTRYINGIRQASGYLSVAFIAGIMGRSQFRISTSTPVGITFIPIHEGSNPVFITQYLQLFFLRSCICEKILCQIVVYLLFGDTHAVSLFLFLHGEADGFFIEGFRVACCAEQLQPEAAYSHSA